MTEYEIFMDTLTKGFVVWAILVAISMPIVFKNLKRQGESLSVWVVLNTIAFGLALSCLAGIYMANAPITLNSLVLVVVTVLCAFIAKKEYFNHISQ